VSKAGSAHAQRMLHWTGCRGRSQSGNGARPRGFVKANMSGKGGGASPQDVPALELTRFPNH
jgi:hypothetical protein